MSGPQVDSILKVGGFDDMKDQRGTRRQLHSFPTYENQSNSHEGYWHTNSFFHFYNNLQTRLLPLVMLNTLMVLQMRLILSISISKQEQNT